MMFGKDFLKSHVLSWRRKVYSDWEDCYIFWQGLPGLRASNWESTATDGWSLDRWHQKTIGACPCHKFPRFPTYVITIHAPTLQTDRQTDGPGRTNHGKHGERVYNGGLRAESQAVSRPRGRGFPRSWLSRYGSHSFAVCGPAAWNSLPAAVRDYAGCSSWIRPILVPC